MDFNWATIAEEISSLYEEMNYCPQNAVDKFLADFKSEKENKYSPIDSKSSNCFNYTWDVLENYRSILTKLFSFTNNLHGVDTLIAYCDYYMAQHDIDDTFGQKLVIAAEIHQVYTILAQNAITGTEVLHDIWNMLYTSVGCTTFSHRLKERIVNFSYQKPTTVMVLMADSDLIGAHQALIRSHNSFFGVYRVLVQEPIEEQLLATFRKSDFLIRISVNLFVFRNIPEALSNLNSDKKLKAVSVWSENIIVAKKFAADLKIGMIWINAHGTIGPGFRLSVNELPSLNYSLNFSDSKEYVDLSKTSQETVKIVEFFYGGKWQIPIEKKYWMNGSGDSFAEASSKDFDNCITVARKGFEIWRSTKISQRTKVIKSFAERLRTRGFLKDAHLVFKLINLSSILGSSLSIVRDAEAEIITTSDPVGVVVVTWEDEKMLLIKLIIASMTGNAVILLSNSKSPMSFTPYYYALVACNFPAGVINCLFTSNPSNLKLEEKPIDGILSKFNEFLSEKFCHPINNKTDENLLYKNILANVTKPKSVWLQCQ